MILIQRINNRKKQTEKAINIKFMRILPVPIEELTPDDINHSNQANFVTFERLKNKLRAEGKEIPDKIDDYQRKIYNEKLYLSQILLDMNHFGMTGTFIIFTCRSFRTKNPTSRKLIRQVSDEHLFSKTKPKYILGVFHTINNLIENNKYLLIERELRITIKNLLQIVKYAINSLTKLIDGIIQEPVGGAHSDRQGAFNAVQEQIVSAFNELKDLSDSDLVMKRMDKYSDMGVYKE